MRCHVSFVHRLSVLKERSKRSVSSTRHFDWSALLVEHLIINDGGNEEPSAQRPFVVVNRDRSSEDGADARPPELIGR